MTKTQAKLLIYKANKFMQKLDGIDSFSITLLYDNSSLMRKEFHQTHNIDCLNDRLFFTSSGKYKSSNQSDSDIIWYS